MMQEIKEKAMNIEMDGIRKTASLVILAALMTGAGSAAPAGRTTGRPGPG